MNPAKRVFCALLTLLMVFGMFTEPFGSLLTARAEAAPTLGSTDVPDAPGELLEMGEWLYWIEDNKAVVAGYQGLAETDLIIPNKLGGCPVYAIGSGAFAKNTALQSIQVPTNVTRIAEDAFAGAVTVKAYHGAYALQYAKDHKYTPQIVTNIPEVDFADGVLDLTGLPRDSYSQLSDKSVYFSADYASFLQEGQILFYPQSADFPGGLAKRVSSITRVDDTLLVIFSQPEWDECFDSVCGEDQMYVDWSQAELAEGIVPDDMQPQSAANAGGSFKLKTTIDLKKLNSNLKGKVEVSGTFGLNLTNIKVSYDIKKHVFTHAEIKSIAVDMDLQNTFNFQIEYSNKLAKEDVTHRMTIIKNVPIASLGGVVNGYFGVDLVVTFKGGIYYSRIETRHIRLELKNGKFTNTTTNPTAPQEELKIEATIKAGVDHQLYMVIGWGDFSIRFLEIGFGPYLTIKGSVSWRNILDPHSTRDSIVCGNISKETTFEISGKIGLIKIYKYDVSDLSFYFNKKFTIGKKTSLHLDSEGVGTLSLSNGFELKCAMDDRIVQYNISTGNIEQKKSVNAFLMPYPSAPEKSGYKFVGWEVDTAASGLTGSNYMLNNDSLMPFCGKKGTLVVNPKYDPIPVSSITLNQTTAVTAYTNAGSLQLKATVKPSNALNPSVKWSSSNTQVVKVSKSGKVTYVGPGTATVTCTSEANPDVKASVKFTLKQYVTDISISGPKSLIEGNTATLTATPKPSNASNKAVSWASGNTSILTVDSSGNIKGIAPGQATVTATAQDGSKKSATTTIRVGKQVTGLSLNKTSHTAYTTDSPLQLVATAAPSDCADPSVTWSSSNSNVVKVSDSGVVTFVKAGTAVVTCKSNSNSAVSASCSFTVKQYAQGVTVSADLAPIPVGSTKQLTATVTPADTTSKALTWSSSNTAVATVDANGKVTAVSSGTATITATAADRGTVKGSFGILAITPEAEPGAPVQSVALASSTLTLHTADKTDTALTATVVPQNDVGRKLHWLSSNPAAATVDANGNVHPVAPGTTTILVCSASDPSRYDTCAVTVLQSVEGLRITTDSDTVALGKTLQLNAVITPENAANKTLTWTSSDSSIASVSSAGKVTGIKDGKVTITAAATDGSGISATIKLTIGNPPPIPVSSITLDCTKIEDYTNAACGYELSATVLPEDADDLTVRWSSTNTDVATVDQTGFVTLVGPGTAQIRCTSVYTPTVYGTCSVTVKQYVEQIYVTGTAARLVIGETTALTPAVFPANASNKNIAWTSSDTSVASVSANGTVTAVTPGKVTITATAVDGSEVSGSYDLIVEKQLQLQVDAINDTVFTQGTDECVLAYVALTNMSATRFKGQNVTWAMEHTEGSGDIQMEVYGSGASSAAVLTGSTFPTAGTETCIVTCTAGNYTETAQIVITADGTAYAQRVKLTPATLGSNTLTTSVNDPVVVPWQPYSADGLPVPAGLTMAIDGDSMYTTYSSEENAEQGKAVTFRCSEIFSATVRYSRANLSYDVNAEFRVTDADGTIKLRVQEIVPDQYSVRMVEGEDFTLGTTVYPEDAANKSLSWTTSDPSVATVSSTGKITAHKPGFAFIDCTADDGFGAAARIIVIVESYLQLDDSVVQYTVCKGGDARADLGIVNVTIDSEARLLADNRNVSWSLTRISGSSTELGLSEYVSDAESGLSVSGNMITLLRINETGTDVYQLTCTADPYSATCRVVVTVEDGNLPESITLNTDCYEASVGEYFDISTAYTVLPAGAELPEGTEVTIDGGNAFWNAMSSLYSFGEPERMIFEKAGVYTANVVFSGSNYHYECPFTVRIADENGVVPTVVTGIVIDENMPMLSVGDTVTLSAQVLPADAVYSRILWSSTDSSVATVSSSGKVTAIGAGYATIIATVPESDYEGTCLVHVEEGINFQNSSIERTVFTDAATRMTLDRVLLTANTSQRLKVEPTWTLRRISGISLTLRAVPCMERSTDGSILYGCDLQLFSVSKEGDTVYELTCSDGSDTATARITVHAVNRDRVLPASISMAQTVFTADIGELIVVRPEITTYPESTKLPNGIRVSCSGDAQYSAALNEQDTYVSQSLSTFSFNTAGTFHADFVYAYSNMRYVIPVTFRIRDVDGNVPVQASCVTLNRQFTSLTVGETNRLEAVFTPADTTNKEVSWNSSNPKVVTVDASGRITAVAKGTAFIVCTPADTQFAPISCTVSVEDYLTVTAQGEGRNLFLQGDQQCYAAGASLSEGALLRMQRDGITPVWTVNSQDLTHVEVSLQPMEDDTGMMVYTQRLISAGTDNLTITCTAGTHTWSNTFPIRVTDLGSTAPQSVEISQKSVHTEVGRTVTIDFTPIAKPAGTALPADMEDLGVWGIGDFWSALDWSSYEENGYTFTAAFTRPGTYLLTRKYFKDNLSYVTSCSVVVGDPDSRCGLLTATETEFTVYSGGKSGSVSTVSLADSVAAELWEGRMQWSAQRISGSSMTVALKEHDGKADVFVADVQNNGTDVWRISCTLDDVTDYVDITLTAATPRAPLPESISLQTNRFAEMIGNTISIPLGVSTQPVGSLLPDTGDDFWSFRFDGVGEDSSTHEISNGMLKVVFSMSGYYTGILTYRSGNVSYSIPVYFVIQDEEQEIRQPDLKLYLTDTFSTVYPEGDTNVVIGHVIAAESLNTYSTGTAIAYMNSVDAAWSVTTSGTAAGLKLVRSSSNVYDLVLTEMAGIGDISYTVTCDLPNRTIRSAAGTLHVAAAGEKRPDATASASIYQAVVGEKVTIDSRMYSREDGSALQSSSSFDSSALLAAIGYELTQTDDSWQMRFYEPGTYQAGIHAYVSNLKVEVPVTICVVSDSGQIVLQALTMPGMLTRIDESAFEGVAAQAADLRGSRVTEIGAFAFRNSIDLRVVYLPDTVQSIADNAFYGCLNVTFCCNADSYAASWASAHGYEVNAP